MKLPLATGLLSAAILVGCGGASGPTTTASAQGRWVMRVDRTYDRTNQPTTPSENLPSESYRDEAPVDRWEVSIENGRVILVALAAGSTSVAPSRLEGHEVSGAGLAGERRFELDQGAFAGGRFIVRGDDAELTMFGSGVPIVMSERGKLLSR